MLNWLTQKILASEQAYAKTLKNAIVKDVKGTSPPLSTDWSKGFYLSKYKGKPCVIVQSSGTYSVFA